MNNQYLTCDWIVQPLTQPNSNDASILNKAGQSAQQAGCDFFMVNPYQNDDGLYIMLLIWKGASQELLHETIRQIQTYMRLANIRTASQDEVQLFEKLRSSSDTGLLALVHYLNEAGFHNEQLLRDQRNN